MTPELALQAAVTGLLLADPDVSALVGGKIFDEIPAGAPTGQPKLTPPWIYLGPVSRRRLETGCGNTWTITMRLYAASTGFGRKEAWEIGSAAATALEGEQPDLAAPYSLVEVIRCLQGGDVIEPAQPKAVYLDITTTITR